MKITINQDVRSKALLIYSTERTPVESLSTKGAIFSCGLLHREHPKILVSRFFIYDISRLRQSKGLEDQTKMTAHNGTLKWPCRTQVLDSIFGSVINRSTMWPYILRIYNNSILHIQHLSLHIRTLQRKGCLL